MYKPIIERFQQIKAEAVQQNQDVLLFVKTDEGHVRVTENIAVFLEKKDMGPNELPRVKLKFANGQIVIVYGYSDNSITPGTIVSSLGYFKKNGEVLQYSNRCGMRRVYNSFREIGRVKVDDSYKVGFWELTTPQESTIYQPSSEFNQLEDNIFYFVGDVSTLQEVAKLEEGEIDVSQCEDYFVV